MTNDRYALLYNNNILTLHCRSDGLATQIADDAGSETFRLIINIQTIPFAVSKKCIGPQRVHFINPKVNESNSVRSV